MKNATPVIPADRVTFLFMVPLNQEYTGILACPESGFLCKNRSSPVAPPPQWPKGKAKTAISLP